MNNVLAEKVETILRRGTLNTRMRDFYDIHMLMKIYKEDLDSLECANYLINTMDSFASTIFFTNHEETIESLRQDDKMQAQWQNYQRQFNYATDIDFLATLNECIDYCNKEAPHIF